MHNAKMIKHSRKKRLLATMLSVALLLSLPLPASASTGNINANVVADSLAVAKQVEAEGIVLLKNEGPVLPLAAEKGINVFGSASIDPYYGSSGSGSIKSDTLIGFYDGLRLAGISYNEALYNTYQSWYGKNGKHKEMPVENIDFTQACAYSDTAVLMIGRAGSEGGDLEPAELQLTSDERLLLDQVCASFPNVIVLFNIVNIMEMGFLEEYDSIRAAAIIWTPGEAGMESVAKMLSGEINPSGRLQDTVAWQTADHPSSANFGDYSYANVKASFVEYEEGIYVGYRYFETFGVDVQYPFGYGLSYTSFTWSDMILSESGNTRTVSLTVTNTGSRAGKDVVEIYVSVPYLPGGVEKSSVQLAAYVKTPLLAPGESAVCSASFDIWDLASYDYMGEQAWILDAGTYAVHVSSDVRTPLGELAFILPEKLVKKYDEVSGTEIKNLFADALSPNMTVLSRANRDGTYPSTPMGQNCPFDLSDMDAAIIPPLEEGAQAPALGIIHENTIYLQNVWANPSLEDSFLDQLTLDEMIDLICNCGYKTPGVDRLGIPKTNDNDGPASVKGSGGLLYKDSGVAWPAGVCLSCTWNDALAYEHGVRCGVEAKSIGTSIWYAPTANLHRNPRGGRNFEYFFFFSVVCGRMASAIVQGAQSQNLTVTVKHLVLNEQETNRWGILTWADEQTIRELYLKPFETAIKKGGARGVMSAYSRLGKTWCGGSNILLTELLRREWGYSHYVVSDFSVYGLYGTYMNPIQAVYAGNDAMLTGIYVVQFFPVLDKMRKEYEANPIAFGRAMRECVRNIIHMKMASSAFSAENLGAGGIRVEGETAVVNGKTVKDKDFVEKADGASQGFVLCNLSKKGNVVTWTFEVPDTGSYDLTMALASTNLFGKNDNLAEQVIMQVNGADVDVSQIEIFGSGFLKYNRFSTYGPLQVELVSGTNTITWTTTGYSVPNVDYLDFYKTPEEIPCY